MTALLIVLLHDKITLEIVGFGRVLFPNGTLLESSLFTIECSAFYVKVDTYLEQHASEHDWGTILLNFVDNT